MDGNRNLAVKDSEKRIPSWLIITIISAIAVIIITIVTAVAVSSASYKKPIKNIVRGVNKADTVLLMESIYPDSNISFRKIEKNKDGVEWETYIKQNDKYIKTKMKEMRLDKAKCDILAKEEISGSNFEAIRDFYSKNYDVEVKKAYRAEVDMTFKINGGGNETPSGWVCVVKIKGEGWKFCPEYSEKHFDFIDEAIDFQ